MRIAAWILSCYPRRWRERYQEEMLALLEQHTITIRTVLDLLLGALDAHLDPAYRSREGYMFLQRIRDIRSLSVIYLCALAIFLFAARFWLVLGGSLAFQDNAIGSTTNTLGAICVYIVPLIGLIALLGIVGTTIKNAFKNRQWGVLIFALICLGLIIGMLSQSLPFPPSPDFPLIVYIPDLLMALEVALLLGSGLFIAGIKGLSLLRDRQGWPLLFALLIGLLLPASQIIYALWGWRGISPGTTVQLAPGSLLVGSIVFSSLPDFIRFLLNEWGPYFTLSALLLILAYDNLSIRGWRVTRVFGVLLTLLLLFNLVIVVIWDVNRWIVGGVWIFDPAVGVWPFFGAQWLGPLITNALILAVALIFALLALIRGFLIRPGGERTTEHVAV